MVKLLVFLRENGFIFQSSKIYGGMANSWDFGPLGVEIKNNIKKIWWKEFVQKDINVEGLDSSIILNSKVWKASGHLDSFSDPLIDCKECKTRHRADKIIEEKTGQQVEGWKFDKIEQFLLKNKVNCPKCGNFNYTKIRNFNLMFQVDMSITGDEEKAYLRPETAQGIFINFANVAKTTNQKLPFGIGQIGKSFRNEITPGNFIFRTKEFEQMELEFFFNEKIDKNDWFEYYVLKIKRFLLNMGIDSNLLIKREHKKNELSHYSTRTCDFEFKFSFGTKELCGIAHRGTFDIDAHNKNADEKQIIRDGYTNEVITPSVIEPSIGVERLMLAILTSAYKIENGREILKIKPNIAPIKATILPLVKKIHSSKAMEIYKIFAEKFNTKIVVNGSIGKRYKKQDKIGTPFCITIDDQTLENNTITIRYRDNASQEKLTIDEAINKIKGAIESYE